MVRIIALGQKLTKLENSKFFSRNIYEKLKILLIHKPKS